MVNKSKNFRSKKLVFVDLETTGVIVDKHEILELGSIVVDGSTLDVSFEFYKKVKPVHIERAQSEALKLVGFTKEGWRDAEEAEKVLREFNDLAAGGMVMGWNVAFDWQFLEHGFRKFGIRSKLDYHRLDVLSMAYIKLFRNPKVTSLKLRSVAELYDINLPKDNHNAMEDIRATFEIFKKLI